MDSSYTILSHDFGISSHSHQIINPAQEIRTLEDTYRKHVLRRSL